MTRLVLAAVVGALALVGPLEAQSVAGEWNAQMGTPGGVRAFKIVFKVDGEKLTGTVKREAGDVPLAGTIKGDTVKFAYTVLYNGGTLDLTMTAKVTGDSMKGTVDFGGQAQDEFSAKRAGAAPGAGAGLVERR